MSYAKKSANQLLAENLARLMSEKGLNNVALAKRAGLAPNTVGNYLETTPSITSRGKERSAKLAEVEKLAAALEVSLVELVTERSDAPAEEPRPAYSNPRTRQLLNDLDDLSPPKQSKFIDMIHEEAESAREAAAYLIERRRPTMAAAIGGNRTSTPIKHGDGNPDQQPLPLSTVADPFTAAPDPRELALYARFASKAPSRT